MSDTILPELSELEPERDGQRQAVAGVALITAFLLIAGVVAAFAIGNTDGRTGRARLLSAGAAVDDAKTFHFEMKMSFAAGGQSTNLGMVGDVDSTAKRSALTISGAPGSPPSSIVGDGNVVYVSVPESARTQTGGKPFARFDLSAAVAQMGTPAGGEALSPMQSLEQVKSVGATIDDVGHESVRGVDTTHYRTTLDATKKLPAAMATTAPSAVLDQLRAVPCDVWLDSQDRPRRVQTKITISIPSASTSAFTSTSTLELFDFGKPVTIDVPPADQVFDGGTAPSSMTRFLSSLFSPAGFADSQPSS